MIEVLARTFTHRLLRDLQASWQKTAVLGVLLIVGLCFWVPPLVRTFARSSRPARSAGAPAANEALPASRPAEVAVLPAPGPSTSTPEASSHERVERILETDPLVHSAEVAAIRSDPFQIDEDQFPPPILFAEDDVRPPSRSESASAAEPDPAAPEGLVLSTTVVGTRRRAAIINDRLYFEGSEVRHEGRSYVLAKVDRRSALLARGETSFELRLPAPTFSLPTVETEPATTDADADARGR